MNRLDIMQRIRSITRDLSNAIFREIDLIDYTNEGIDRIKQIIPEFKGMPYLNTNNDVPSMLPSEYHHLLAVYSASRCFGQDERHYQASNYMNEFESKMDTLKSDIEAGNIVVIDPTTGLPVDTNNSIDYVKNNYYFSKSGLLDIDEGVEGVN